MKLPDVNGYVLWLLPDHKSAEFYRSEIERLSDQYQSFPFLPHITLSRVPDWNLPRLKTAVAQITEVAQQFFVQLTRVNCGDVPYQKITAEVQKTEQLRNLYDVTDNVLGGNFSKREYPHLSLHYSTGSCREFSAEIENLQGKLRSPIKIAQIALISLEGTPNQWKVVYSKYMKTNSSRIS